MRTDEGMFKHCCVEKAWRIIRENLRGLVLDIGSFDGLLVAPHQGAIGLDIEATESYIPLIVGDMHHLPFKGESFDTVTMCHVLEHTEEPERVVKEVRRVLKNDGKLVVAVPNAKALAGRVLKFLLGYDNFAYSNPKTTARDWLHKSFFGYQELRSLLESNGFEVEMSYGSTPYLPFIDKLFDHGFLRKIWWSLGDVSQKQDKDLIFICRLDRIKIN